MLSKSNVTGKHYWRGKEITEADYNHIKAIIDSRPAAPDGYGYRLTESLEWELYELPPAEEDAATDEEYAEAGKILLGVSE